MTHKKPSAVRHGNGGGAPIDEQARHFTTSCLTKLEKLLDAQRIITGPDKTDHEVDDPRLQFWVARYLLELGWGRSPMRRADTADDIIPEEWRVKADKIFREKYDDSETYKPSPSGPAEDAGNSHARSMVAERPHHPADAGR